MLLYLLLVRGLSPLLFYSLLDLHGNLFKLVLQLSIIGFGFILVQCQNYVVEV